MQLHNALMPDDGQMSHLRTASDSQPVVMVNLLRFRALAAYADGRPSDLTGEQAFMLYSDQMKTIVQGLGGRFLISLLLDRLIIGTGDMVWHRLATVEYPSRAAFAQVTANPAVREAAVHRHAGLEGQLLISATLQADLRAG